MPKKVVHYLISVPSPNVYMHAYLMTNDKKALEKVGLKALQELEKIAPNVLPVIMVATLEDSGIRIVRDFLSRDWPDAEKAFNSATDFHVSIWSMPTNHPDHDKIVKLQ